MKGPGRYILDADGNPQLEPDLIKWGKWMQTNKHQVAHDYIGNARVSTIFLGLDYSPLPFLTSFPYHAPVLWETMIFDCDHGEHDLYQERYTSREAALRGHQKALEMMREPREKS